MLLPPASPARSRDWGTVLQSLLWLLGQGVGTAGHARPCHHLTDLPGMLGEGGDEPALADRSQLPASNGNKDSKGLGWSLDVDLALNILRERICWKKTLFLLSLSMSYLILYWIFQPDVLPAVSTSLILGGQITQKVPFGQNLKGNMTVPSQSPLAEGAKPLRLGFQRDLYLQISVRWCFSNFAGLVLPGYQQGALQRNCQGRSCWFATALAGQGGAGSWDTGG